MSQVISEPLSPRERADSLAMHVGRSDDFVQELHQLKDRQLVEDCGHLGDRFWLVVGGETFGYERKTGI